MSKRRHMIDGWGGSQSDAFAGGIEAAGRVGAAGSQDAAAHPGGSGPTPACVPPASPALPSD